MKRRLAARLLVVFACFAGGLSAQTTVAVLDATDVSEGDGGTVTVSFPVVVTSSEEPEGPAPFPVIVDLALIDGTATAADGDFVVPPVIQLVFPDDDVQPVFIDIQGDTKVEADETFSLLITNVSPGASIDPGQNEGFTTILNDDATELSIGDVVVGEGGPGTTSDAVFAVSLSALSDFPVAVEFDTADGSATTGGGDYQSASGTLNIPPGAPGGTITVQVNGDGTVEPDESFSVDLTMPTGATIDDGQGVGTILNDDAATLSIGDVTVVEGDAGSLDAVFTVTLSQMSPAPVMVDFVTSDGTATVSDDDYEAAAGTLTFNPGELTRPVAVTITGDTTVEADESFFVDLSAAVGATIADGRGEGTITNDDGATVSIADAALDERDSGGRNVVLEVTLSAPSATPVSARFATRDGTATVAGNDYRQRSGEVRFAPGQTLRELIVVVIGDTAVEADETFFVELADPDGATLGDPLAEVTIRNDDRAPGVIRLAGPPDIAENGVTAFVVVERVAGASGPAAVDFATADGTAQAGVDYASAAGTLSWADGESGGKSFELPIIDDNLREGDETVIVRLLDPVGAALGDPDRLDLVIIDDDRPAQLEPVGSTEVSGRAGGRLELRARASRADGSPVAGVEVLWEIDGDAVFAADAPPATTSTGADGTTTQTVELGGTPGTVSVSARIEATDQVVTFEVAVADGLGELFDPARDPARSSVAGAISQACRGDAGGFGDLCDYIFGLDPDEQRELIGELTPVEAGALADLLLQSPHAQLFNVRQHLAARRGGGGGGSTIALGLTGQNVPLEVLRQAFAGELEVVRRMTARIDAAMFQLSEVEEADESPAEPDVASRFSFFASGRLDIGERPGSEREAGFDLETLGLTLGLDYLLSPRVVVGGALGYVDTATEVDRDGGGIDLRGYSLSGFVTYFRDRFWFDGILSYSWSEYEFLRHIDLPRPFAGASRLAARGSPDGSQLAVELGAGYDRSFGATSLSGFGRLSWIDAEVDAFSEQGAGSFGLALRAQQAESLLAEAGIEIVRATSRSWGVLQPVVRASVLHEFADDSRVVVASFAGDAGGNMFELPTDRPDRDFFRLGLGLTATLARGRALYVLYETDLEREDLDLYRLTGGLRLEF